MIATISGSFIKSYSSTVAIICVSRLKFLWNNGLIGLSINLEVNVSFSDGRPSLLKKPPGILPAEKAFSW